MLKRILQSSSRWLAPTLLAIASGLSVPAQAEVNKLRIAIQPAITYLPFLVIQEGKLLESTARADGLGDIEVTWHKFSGGNIMNEALLSGNLDFAITGAPSFLILWDKGQSTLGVRGVSSYGSTPLFLVSRNPNVKTIQDLSNADRIAVPAVKSSVQAMVLQMAAEAQWGKGQHGRLDGFTVSRGHPDAYAAIMSPNNEINGHFSSPPYAQYELAQPGFRMVLNAYDVFGGPFSNGVMYATQKFYQANPKLTAAFVKALDQSLALIRAQPRKAAEIYLKLSGDKMSLDEVERIIADPLADWTSTPKGMFQFADFMHRTGSIKRRPESWKDLFFPVAHHMSGS